LAVRIRLKRAGSTHRPFYKIVVADSRSPRDGRAIEALGHYDPVKKPEVIEVNEDRLGHWVSKGAIMSESVEALVRRMKKRAERGDAFDAEEAVEVAPVTEAPEDSAAGEKEKASEPSGAEASESKVEEAGESETGGSDSVPEGESKNE
jgi:small subunit ribosomal protein S16